MSLKSKLLLRIPFGLIILGVMLFIPAGSLRFWRGWAWIAGLFVPNVFFFLYLFKHNPQLLERRLQAKEKAGVQNLIKATASLIFFSSLLLCGFDYRFRWSRTLLTPVPLWLTLLSLALAVSGLLVVFWVMRVNSFAARTIRVELGQTVISAGPYRWVRHPMYFGLLVTSLSTPLALGSYIAMPTITLLIPVIVLRLLNEEKILRRELAGYSEYCLHTPFRLIPCVW